MNFSGDASAPQLLNPVRNARAVAAALRRLGFAEMIEREDLTRARLEKEPKDFGDKAAGAGWAVIYFAGLMSRNIRDQVVGRTRNAQEPFTYGSLPERNCISGRPPGRGRPAVHFRERPLASGKGAIPMPRECLGQHLIFARVPMRPNSSAIAILARVLGGLTADGPSVPLTAARSLMEASRSGEPRPARLPRSRPSRRSDF